MLTLLFVLLALAIILEVISFKRDPDMIELDFSVSTLCTEPGEPFHTLAIVENGSRIPLSYLAVVESYPSGANIPEDMIFRRRQDEILVKKICRVKARQRKRLILETSVSKRGVHIINGDAIEFGDFLGFQEYSKKIYFSRREVVVYPERLSAPDLSDALGRFYGDIAARRFLIRDPILTVGCREYTGREPMKEIHWLQSARRSELMVREFDYTRQLSASVILGVDEIEVKDEEGLDLCCSAVRSVCEKLADAGVSVSFFTNSRLMRIHGKEFWKCDVSAGHTGTLLEGLGRVTCYSKGTLNALLEFAMLNSDYDAAFVVVLPANDSRGAEAVNILRSKSGRETLLIQMGEVRVES